MTDSWHLAQLNIARPRAPLDDPIMAEFMANLERINALGDASPGFVWRLQDDSGNATALEQPFGPEIIVNMTVWEECRGAARLRVPQRAHRLPAPPRRMVRQADGPTSVLWWVPAGHRPDSGRGEGRGSTGWPSWARRRRLQLRPTLCGGWPAGPPRVGRLTPMSRRSASWSSASATWGAATPGLSPARRVRDRRPDEPQHPRHGRRAAARAARLPAVRGLRGGPARDPARRGLDQHLSRHPRGLRACAPWTRAATCSWRSRSRPRSPTPRRSWPRRSRPAASWCWATSCACTPPGQKLVEIGRGLGKPLVMRMNLNQQSSGPGLGLAPAT